MKEETITHLVFLHLGLHFQPVPRQSPKIETKEGTLLIKTFRSILSFVNACEHTLIFGFFSLRNFPTPAIVPAVPMPATTASTFPPVSLHISGPVVS